jgi:maleylacetoacetate isomerase
MNTPVLYQSWRSSASWRVRWALAVKGVSVEHVWFDLATGVQQEPEHLARNPMGRVPALFIDGVHLAESVAIIEYLDEKYPTPALYPKHALHRARVRQLVELVNSGVQPMQNRSVYIVHSREDDAQKKWIHHFNEKGMIALEKLLEQVAAEIGIDGPYAFGDSLSAADIFLVPQAAAARKFGVDMSQFPRVVQAEAAALRDEKAQACLPENQPGAVR